MAKKKSNQLSKKLWVIKAGSQMICQGGPMLIRSWMGQIAQLKKKHGIDVIWVTSGAIATAADRTGFKNLKSKTLSEKQALSAIGQPMVMELYQLALQTQGQMAAQVLLTYDDLSNKERLKNFKNTIAQLLKWHITPIINENDAVATQEIRFGDNDSLSARVAVATKANKLVILTDVDGLYDKDPKKNKDAKLVSELKKISAAHLLSLKKQSDKKSIQSRGTGGMYSKILAAKIASEKGIETHLLKGDYPNVIIDIAHGKRFGTRVLKR